jgi:hypothetical protein
MPDATAAPAPSPNPTLDDEAKRKKKKRTIIIVVVIAAVVAAIVAMLAVNAYQEKQAEERAQAAYEYAHRNVAVQFSIEAPGYDDNDSKIPLKVTGTDLDGNEVDEEAFIGPDGLGLELKRGTYTVVVEASPLLDEGVLYDVPDTKMTIEVGDDASPDEVYQAPADATITLTTIEPLNITDAQIDASYQAALRSGLDSDTAINYKQAVIDNRTAAQEEADRIAAEQAAEAERQAAEQAELERQAQIAENNSAAKAAYRTLLANGFDWTSGSSNTSYDSSDYRFAIYDIDGDGVVELLVDNPNTITADGCQFRVFTYYNGQVVENVLDNSEWGLLCFEGTDVVGLAGGRMGTYGESLYTISEGHLVLLATAQYMDEYDYEKYGSGEPNLHEQTGINPIFSGDGSQSDSTSYIFTVCQVNGADVDYNTYESTVESLTDGVNGVWFDYVDNTEANRASVLG